MILGSSYLYFKKDSWKIRNLTLPVLILDFGLNDGIGKERTWNNNIPLIIFSASEERCQFSSNLSLEIEINEVCHSVIYLHMLEQMRTNCLSVLPGSFANRFTFSVLLSTCPRGQRPLDALNRLYVSLNKSIIVCLH